MLLCLAPSSSRRSLLGLGLPSWLGFARVSSSTICWFACSAGLTSAASYSTATDKLGRVQGLRFSPMAAWRVQFRHHCGYFRYALNFWYGLRELLRCQRFPALVALTCRLFRIPCGLHRRPRTRGEGISGYPKPPESNPARRDGIFLPHVRLPDSAPAFFVSRSGELIRRSSWGS